MAATALTRVWIILIYIHGCLGAGVNVRITLDWGYIHFNLTEGADASSFQCAKDYSLLAVNQQKKDDILTAFKSLVKDIGNDVCYSQSDEVVYQPSIINCAKQFEIKEKSEVKADKNRTKLKWTLVRIANAYPANQTTDYCLVYDIETSEMAELRCSGNKIPGVACQKNPPSADKPESVNMNQIIIIGSSIGLSSLVLQVSILIGCAVHWCRKRQNCGGGQREVRPKPSDAARCVRLQSLTSDSSSAAYDHVPRDQLSRSLHSLNHMQQKQQQDGHVYNELGGMADSTYSLPYTHLVPPTHPRNPPPKGPPPILPSGNEYAEPFRGPDGV